MGAVKTLGEFQIISNRRDQGAPNTNAFLCHCHFLENKIDSQNALCLTQSACIVGTMKFPNFSHIFKGNSNSSKRVKIAGAEYAATLEETTATHQAIIDRFTMPKDERVPRPGPVKQSSLSRTQKRNRHKRLKRKHLRLEMEYRDLPPEETTVMLMDGREKYWVCNGSSDGTPLTSIPPDLQDEVEEVHVTNFTISIAHDDEGLQLWDRNGNIVARLIPRKRAKNHQKNDSTPLYEALCAYEGESICRYLICCCSLTNVLITNLSVTQTNHPLSNAAKQK